MCLLTLWLAVTGLGFCPGVASAATDSAATHDTATRVRQVRPGTGTVQAAVDVARPGDVLALHADTYSGRVFTPLGTERRTIVIRPLGNGGPTVRQSFTPADCSASRPNVNRILRFRDGVAW